MSEETWGELSEAMRALPNDKWRAFVRHYCADPKFGAGARAYRAAGFNTQKASQEAYHLLRDDRVITAIAEESKKILRGIHPAAVNALANMINDSSHKDHARAVAMVLDRLHVIETRHDMVVEHRSRSLQISKRWTSIRPCWRWE